MLGIVSIRERIESDGDYKKALLFSKAFTPKEGLQYKWVYEYALNQYERVEHTFKTLDNKADFMIKCLIPGSGILGLVITAIAKYNTGILFSILGIIGLVLLICSLIFSALSLKPGKHYLPPYIKQALETVNHYKNEEYSFAYFATGIDLAIEKNMVVNTVKTEWIKLSYLFFVMGIIWLFVIIPLCYAFSTYLSFSCG